MYAVLLGINSVYNLICTHTPQLLVAELQDWLTELHMLPLPHGPSANAVIDTCSSDERARRVATPKKWLKTESLEMKYRVEVMRLSNLTLKDVSTNSFTVHLLPPVSAFGFLACGVLPFSFTLPKHAQRNTQCTTPSYTWVMPSVHICIISYHVYFFSHSTYLQR